MRADIIVLSAFLFFMSSTSWAETSWEAYLNHPTSENAIHVNKIEYTAGKIPQNYGYWDPDLNILRNQVLGGDAEAFRRAFRLFRNSDGGLREELNAVLSHSIRPHPQFFLAQISELQPSEIELRKILLMPGLEYVDRSQARTYELEMRRKALSSVSERKLLLLRDRCLNLMKQDKR